MKQKGKTWYTSKGEATLSKYLPPYEVITERICSKLATTAEDLSKRLTEAKWEAIRACYEVYQEYLKTNPEIKRLGFTNFDKTFKVEFDVNERYVRIYRATKAEPGYKDYELISLDFNSAIDYEALEKERNELKATLFNDYPVTEDEAFQATGTSRVGANSAHSFTEGSEYTLHRGTGSPSIKEVIESERIPADDEQPQKSSHYEKKSATVSEGTPEPKLVPRAKEDRGKQGELLPRED